MTLAETLQHFPLALRQATAFINNQRDRDDFSISKYIDRYNRNACKMLDSVNFQKRSTNPYQKTTYTTWITTIDAIEADELNGLLAIKIFKMIAYFAADDIKRDFFLHFTEFDDANEQADYEDDLKSAVDLLVKHCMIDGRDKQRIFSIHRLVQDVTKHRLRDSHEDEPILRDALKLMSELMTGARTYACSIPLHSISVYLSALHLPDLMKEFGSLAVTILNHLVHSRKYDQAKEFGEKIVGPLIEIFGSSDRILLQIQCQIAKVYLKSLMFHQSLQLNLAIFDKQKIHLGVDDFDTLKTQSQVADSYEALGEDQKALQWYEEVLMKQNLCLDENHPDKLETVCKVAYSLKELGQDDAALQLYEEVFVKRRSLFEPTRIPILTVDDNFVYMSKRIGNRDVQLKTHTDFLTHLTGWIMGDRKKPSTLEEKQKLRQGIFSVFSSTRSQFIHTLYSTSTLFHFSQSHLPVNEIVHQF